MTSKDLTKIKEVSSEIRDICRFWYCFDTLIAAPLHTFHILSDFGF